jgi:hypothetical protein
MNLLVGIIGLLVAFLYMLTARRGTRERVVDRELY